MATPGIAITYGGFLVGGTSAYRIDGFTQHAIQDGVTDSFIEFDFVVVGSTIQEFSDRCNSVELAFRRPRQNLAVTQEGHNMIVAAHDAAQGGFNTEPEIRKTGDNGDTGRSRIYTIRIRFETPADTVSTLGLRESIVNVAFDASRIRTIKFSGMFTGVPGTPSARASYEASIDAHAAAILTALSVTTSELILEPVTEQDYDDKTLRFERTYKELIFGQGQDSPIDDPELSDQQLTVSRREFAEERSPLSGPSSTGEPTSSASGGVNPKVADAPSAGGNVQALAIFDLNYSCSVDATVTVDLKAKYDQIREWLVGQFNAAFSQGAFALTVERPLFDRANNRIVVDMTAEGAVNGVDFVRRTVTTEKSEETSKVFVPAWTGNDLDFFIYQGHATVLTTTTVVTRFLSTKDKAQAEAANEAAALSISGGGGGGGHKTLGRSVTQAVRIGIEGSGHTLDMNDVTSTVTSRKANNVNGGSAGAGELGVPGGSLGGSVVNTRGGLGGLSGPGGIGPAVGALIGGG